MAVARASVTAIDFRIAVLLVDSRAILCSPLAFVTPLETFNGSPNLSGVLTFKKLLSGTISKENLVS